MGSHYAGWKTRQHNLARHVAADGRLDPTFRYVTGWCAGGRLERLPIPGAITGRARALVEARPFASARADITWTSCLELALPYLPARLGPRARPLVVETDWTLAQQESMAASYFAREPRRGLRLRLSQVQERLLFSQVSLFITFSNWAADGLRALGIQDGRIRVVHPGLDLAAWNPSPPSPRNDAPLRMLFVGGDFARKGGDILLDLMRGPLAGRCELDIVTRDAVGAAPPGVRVHRLETNSGELRALYQRADLFVMPTRAEAFGLVSVEAMASGLPVIVSDVGGARDIVEPGRTGWLIQPTAADTLAAIEHALSLGDTLGDIGRRGRARAECLFDGARNDRVLVDLMLEQVARHRACKHGARGSGR